MNTAERWSTYWANEGASGEVYVDSRGAKHPFLTEFWQKDLSCLLADEKCMDIASGAGSIYADQPQLKGADLYAADISATALKQLKSRLPWVKTIECSAASVPAEDGMFDLVVSQFGIEYAGKEAFIEGARVLKSRGRFTYLCHFKDGYIDSKNKRELEAAIFVKQLNFLACALEITNAAYDKDATLFEQAFNQFTAVEPLLSKYIETNNTGIHAHLYYGFKKLFLAKNNYIKKDIIDWLENMSREIDETINRLTDMRKAAQSKKDIDETVSLLGKEGMINLSYEPFTLPNQKLPIAWCIKGQKI